jgi:hypothetical protein
MGRYKELKEPCRSAIAEGRCLGCSKLEEEEFEGDEECKYVVARYSRNWRIEVRK